MVVDKKTMKISMNGVYAGGEDTLIEAMGMTKIAATSIKELFFSDISIYI